jgi:hypothetical protein
MSTKLGWFTGPIRRLRFPAILYAGFVPLFFLISRQEPLMPDDVALIVLTHAGRVHTILGPDGPVSHTVVEVDGQSQSPYRLQTVIPRRDYHLAGTETDAPIVAALDDIVAVKPFAVPGDIKVNDKVLYRDADGHWRKDELRVTAIRERYECVLRNEDGDTCSVLLDQDIKAMMPAAKAGAKAKTTGRRAGRPRKASAAQPDAAPSVPLRGFTPVPVPAAQPDTREDA